MHLTEMLSISEKARVNDTKDLSGILQKSHNDLTRTELAALALIIVPYKELEIKLCDLAYSNLSDRLIPANV